MGVINGRLQRPFTDIALFLHECLPWLIDI
jgi:hypothetical protein